MSNGRSHPTLTEHHFGARARWDALANGHDLDDDNAVLKREAEIGKRLTRSEKREFLRGWRVGKVRYYQEKLGFLERDLIADELGELGNDLETLYEKHHTALHARWDSEP